MYISIDKTMVAPSQDFGCMQFFLSDIYTRKFGDAMRFKGDKQFWVGVEAYRPPGIETRVARELTQVLCRGPYIMKECDWQGFVGIGACRQVRGEGISASSVAPLETPAAGGGVSVHVAFLGAPHVDESVRAKRACHQNRDVRW